MSIRNAFEEFCRSNRIPMIPIPVEGTPDRLGIIIDGENGEWESFGMCFEEENFFIFYVDFGIQIPREAREQICTYLNEVNYQLKFGGFAMDPESGYLMAKAGQFIYGDDGEKAGQIESTVKVCAVIADAYYKRIMQRAFHAADQCE